MNFYSHSKEEEGKRKLEPHLKDHLRSVSIRMLCIYKRQRHYVNLPLNEKFLKIVGIAHDFGKYTTYFQDYLKTGKEDKHNRHYHSFISAIFGGWLCFENLKDPYEYFPLIAYFTILHHHGDLKNFDDDLPSENDGFDSIENQIEDIKRNKDLISSEYHFQIDDFLHSWERIYNELRRLKYNLLQKDQDFEQKTQVYFLILYTFSLLIDSDKKSAGDVDSVERKELPVWLVDEYKKSQGWDKPEEYLDQMKNEIYNQAVTNLERMERIPNILSLTAPTGLGKTLVNLAVALRIRNIYKHKPRIIYALPFTSIIDQTYETVDKILTILGNEYDRNEQQYLVKHHHLADIEYKKDNEKQTVEKALLLIESWDSEIVVTTFVQLLHSIIAFKNRFIKKFHNIAGSIVILDEIQTLDISYWKLIRQVLLKLTEIFQCTIIFSTATKPLIFEHGDYKELLENYEDYFRGEQLNRTILKPNLEKMKVEEFTNFFREQEVNDGFLKQNSYLIVLNTIKSSIEVYNQLQKLEEVSTYKLFYLSTNIIPAQRRARIKCIKRALKNNKPIILVSTQVVEAGIDLDFQKVYRDIGPFDSIIQVAGRCNRKGKLDGKGEVELIYLTDEHGCSLGNNIYGSTFIAGSENIFKEVENNIEEREFVSLINKYYKFLRSDDNKSSGKSNTVIEAISKLVFHSNYKQQPSVSSFKVIDVITI